MASPLARAITTPLLLPSFLFFFAFSTTAYDKALTTYQVLGLYDFPVGILPKGVLGYELNRATGKFTAHFNSTCSFSLKGSYQLRYRPRVSGFISRDRIQDLIGISVEVLLFWLNIIEVIRDGDQVNFSFGITSASFSVDNFADCRLCSCGDDDDDDIDHVCIRRCRPFHGVSSS